MLGLKRAREVAGTHLLLAHRLANDAHYDRREHLQQRGAIDARRRADRLLNLNFVVAEHMAEDAVTRPLLIVHNDVAEIPEHRTVVILLKRVG